MTTVQLYAIYVHAYRDAPRLLEAGVEPGLMHELQAPGSPPPVARVVALLALDDATNGRPLRSRAQFERAVAHGSGALGPLGLREAQPAVAAAGAGRRRLPRRVLATDDAA